MTLMDLFNYIGMPPLLGVLILSAIVLILVKICLSLRKSRQPETQENEAPQPAAVVSHGNSADVIAAIAAAVNEYRKNENR